VLNSVRGYIGTSEAESSRQLYRISVIAQVSRDLPGLLRNQAALLILGLLVVLLIVLIGGVIFPAVWSSKKKRRAAALDVSTVFCDGDVDLMVGGPPCQRFTSGRHMCRAGLTGRRAVPPACPCPEPGTA
jgi:hypothetical protein